MEVGFFFGAGPAGAEAYPNLARSTGVSIMSTRREFNQIPREGWNGSVYGLVNESILCQAVNVYTSQAGAICDRHLASNNTP